MSCITIIKKEEGLGSLTILTCNICKVPARVVAVMLLIFLLDPPSCALLHEKFSAIFWHSQKLVVPRSLPPCSKPSSLDPASLFIFTQGVICLLPSQHKPKIQLSIYVYTINQVPNNIIFIGLHKRQEVSIAMTILVCL